MELTTPHPHAFGPSNPVPNPLRPASALRRRLATAAVAVAMLGVGVWAGTQIGGSSATGNVPERPSTTPRPSSTPLSARVIGPHALPGFSLSADSAPVSSAYDWARAERSQTPGRETARLRSLGFLGAFDEQLHARYPSQAAAVSIVERYRTAPGAHRELAYQYARLRYQEGAASSTFSVPAIPGARGIRVQSGGHVDMSVVFTSGQYFYVIRTGFPGNAHGVPTPAQLTGAAGTLYLSTNGCVAPAA